MKSTLYVDEKTAEIIGNLPARMSASKILRWTLKALVTPEKQWDALLVNDQSLRETQDWIRPRLIKALRIKEEK